MKNKKSLEQSYFARVKQAMRILNDMHDSLDKTYRYGVTDLRTETLREDLDSLAQAIHEFKAYHTVRVGHRAGLPSLSQQTLQSAFRATEDAKLQIIALQDKFDPAAITALRVCASELLQFTHEYNAYHNSMETD